MKSTVVTFSVIYMIVCCASAALAGGYWVLQGSTVMETMRFKDPATLLINFNPKNNCKPEAALVMWSDDSGVLGNFEKRKVTKDNMTISIDGNSFYSRMTVTKYKNAFESSIGLNEQAVGRFMNGKTATVKVYDTLLAFPLEGIGDVIDVARRNCK